MMNVSEFKPSYVWPSKAFPFRIYLDHPKCRIFIIENIVHNWDWLKRYAHLISKSDYFFVYCGWYHSEHFAIESNTIFSLLNLDKQNFFFLFNSAREQRNFEPYGFQGDVINHNAWIDENYVFKPSQCNKIYNAVYVARLVTFKRHYLASKVKNLALVAGESHSSLIAEAPPHAYMNEQPLDPSGVAQIINSSYCGLILSDSEGACFSSSEYLLCGVPVVSTASTGGRDFWYTEENSIICEPDQDSVVEAVERAIKGKFDKDGIREYHVRQQHQVRNRFVSQLNRVFERFSVDLNADDFFRRTYIHKLRGSMSPNFDELFNVRDSQIMKPSENRNKCLVWTELEVGKSKSLVDSISGAFEPQSLVIFKSIMSLMERRQNSIELGVLHGKSAASIASSFERMSLVDKSPIKHFNEIREAFPSTEIEFHQMLSSEFLKDNVLNFDFAHVDTSHYFSDTFNELMSLNKFMSVHGVVVLDDWNEVYQQVRAAYFRAYYTEKLPWKVFLVSHNKAYLCHADKEEYYLANVMLVKEALDSLGFKSQLVRTDDHLDFRPFLIRPLKVGEPDFYGTNTYGDRFYAVFGGRTRS